MIIADINNLARIHGGRTIFSSLSWTIQDGEKIGLVGPNGIGKSTLLRTLAGLEPADAGALTLRRGTRVAYLPQEYAGEPTLAVLDELLAALADLDILLLDEPDNHLDLARKTMLEQVIREFDGAVVLISHDRYLLDETVGMIAELEPANGAGCRLRIWEGNYSSYVTQKELAL